MQNPSLLLYHEPDFFVSIVFRYVVRELSFPVSSLHRTVCTYSGSLVQAELTDTGFYQTSRDSARGPAVYVCHASSRKFRDNHIAVFAFVSYAATIDIRI